MKRTRLIAICAAVFYILTLIFSVSLIATQSTHEHINEEDCAICAEIQNCNELLRAPAAETGTSENKIRESGFITVIRSRSVSARRNRRITPVSLKDKLTN